MCASCRRLGQRLVKTNGKWNDKDVHEYDLASDQKCPAIGYEEGVPQAGLNFLEHRAKRCVSKMVIEEQLEGDRPALQILEPERPHE